MGGSDEVAGALDHFSNLVRAHLLVARSQDLLINLAVDLLDAAADLRLRVLGGSLQEFLLRVARSSRYCSIRSSAAALLRRASDTFERSSPRRSSKAPSS